ncbi:hypothetical protein [Phytohabitans rumicis]|uniref:Exonuclease domain-containing protein n=1 Tax=Phytohabitans rumicis TaxID=1076125 RepID=A0A6V8LHE5_9ACTN|nr:hypothetical protein [Phytohabitans rumicis]GFJ96652.1 hypothetical protein Prum_102940 [Phytohabitans rumicis]
MRAPLPTANPRTPWREAEFCVLDLETTGLDLRRDEIVAYGAAIVRPGPVAQAAWVERAFLERADTGPAG